MIQYSFGFLIKHFTILFSIPHFMKIWYDIRVKSSKVVRACTIRILNLEPAKHEKEAIYVVNQRISNV